MSCATINACNFNASFPSLTAPKRILKLTTLSSTFVGIKLPKNAKVGVSRQQQQCTTVCLFGGGKGKSSNDNEDLGLAMRACSHDQSEVCFICKIPRKNFQFLFEDIGIKRNEAKISQMAIGMDGCHMLTVGQTGNISFTNPLQASNQLRTDKDKRNSSS